MTAAEQNVLDQLKWDLDYDRRTRAPWQRRAMRCHAAASVLAVLAAEAEGVAS